MKNLQGFEEVAELFIDEDGQKIKPRKSQVEDYEVFNFLEKELKRLTKIDHFFRDQYHIIKQYSQTKTLIYEEQVELDRTKSEFVMKISEEDSYFMDNMNHMFMSVFR